ncbi:Protochlorophyllide-dependent translocon component 52 protein [Thalictrum thalictroides]|uniref:Protochlorophyllide-dependent translocon component 52 protein n=1 Tax=Thalictrum thalictroides TaxID=46969 RepID=A0A7J6VUW5_THATH|nr:Protochlorophyllide-dependent translocon component 52 protein [Thalictrum thalictroides]
MISLKACSFSSTHNSFIPTKPATISSFTQPFKSQQQPVSSLSFKYITTRSRVKFNSSSFSGVSTEPGGVIIPNIENEGETEKFDWYSHWYPVMPLCDLDRRVPHAKKILGIDVVVWWDRNEKKWQVFEDKCPHRLAPLSEGRIDEWGRLQCVYHGWCFNGSGDCKFIPQAPAGGPPVNTSKKACVAVYPSIEQNQILWFWPNSAYQYKDIAAKEKPLYFPELDDPSYYTPTISTRDIPYGYEVMIENFMDPSHVPYAHYDIMPWQSEKSR